MVQIATQRRRAWIDAAWLVVLVAAVLIALALGNNSVLLAVFAAALLGGWLLLRGQTPALASTPPLAAHTDTVAHVQRSVVLADGTPLQALVVPADTVHGYQTVLTINGYALVNAEGRVVHMLSREARAQASEPVVVTIVGAE